MVAGIRAHEADLAKTALDEKYAAEMEALAKDAEALDTEQERLKSALKTCTQSLNEKTARLEELFNEGKRNVKFAIPQSGWKEFGVTDKR